MKAIEAACFLHTQEVRGSSPCAPTIPNAINALRGADAGANSSSDRLLQLFIQERKYLKAVTDKTLALYRDAFRAFEGAADSEPEIKHHLVALTILDTVLRASEARL